MDSILATKIYSKNGFTESETKRYFFDIKKYNQRPKNVLTAGGFLKSSNLHQKPSELFDQQLESEANLSDVEVNVNGDDEAELESKAHNLKKSAPEQEQLPFCHWMINRQLF